MVLLGKGEEQTGGRDKSSILADALEAVFGAVYLDRGLDVARELIERLFRPRMEAYVRGEGDRDYKTILQELASQELRSMPEYRLEERGPDHEKEFTATVHLGGEPMGTGIGRSKKEAEQQAAREAYARISNGSAGRGFVEGDEVELPEVEVMRRDLEKDVVGRRIKDGRGQALQERDAGDPPSHRAQGLHVAPRRAQDHQGRAPRQVPADARSTPATCW